VSYTSDQPLGKGGEMTQTMYAHVNKKIIKKKKERVIQMGKSD
jgi:hypothetical protein